MGKCGRKRLSLGIALSLVLAACDPIPDQILTQDQKRADMLWMYTQFDENYAPLEYKSSRFGFDYAAMKQAYLDEALATPDNESFYRLVHKFVAQFQDAHTSATFSYGNLPRRATLAYLGISGKRRGTVFVVTELLPTFEVDKTSYPVQVGDEISSMDGRPLTDLIREQMQTGRNLGHAEANLTFHMNRLFTRLSTAQGMPAGKDVTLTIVRRRMTADERSLASERLGRPVSDNAKKDVRLEVMVPWVRKDIYEFKKDQKQATASVSGTGTYRLEGGPDGSPLFFGLRGFNGQLQDVSKNVARLSRRHAEYRFLDSFYFADQVESWTAQLATEKMDSAEAAAASSTLTQLKSARHVPVRARFVTEEKATFPTYVTQETAAGGRRELVATMYLNTFSPGEKSPKVVQEFKQTLEALQLFGVRKLVIDLINNGGGSLGLGMELAQALSNKKVAMPFMQFRTSQTWRDEFLGMSLEAPSDAEKELAGRVYRQLQTDMLDGKRLSAPISAEVLIPFKLASNTQLERNFEVVLLVNEMCASMCDIFTGILKDNHLAQVVGTQTMGAGGNVVNHFQAPASHFEVQQTESLIVRNIPGQETTPISDRYIENQGIVPDHLFNVSEDSDTKYRKIGRASCRERVSSPV